VVDYVIYLNPLTYGVDGLRFALLGTSTNSVWVDLAGIFIAAVIMITLATLAFKKAQVD
jgi:ABC-2 type transport system permease protein